MYRSFASLGRMHAVAYHFRRLQSSLTRTPSPKPFTSLSNPPGSSVAFALPPHFATVTPSHIRKAPPLLPPPSTRPSIDAAPPPHPAVYSQTIPESPLPARVPLRLPLFASYTGRKLDASYFTPVACIHPSTPKRRGQRVSFLSLGVLRVVALGFILLVLQRACGGIAHLATPPAARHSVPTRRLVFWWICSPPSCSCTACVSQECVSGGHGRGVGGPLGLLRRAPTPPPESPGVPRA